MDEDNNSWRNVQQRLSGPAITPIAQKRRRFVLRKRVLAGLAIVAIVGAVAFGLYYLSLHSKTFAPYAQEQNKTKIVFFSDGQLTQNWFEDEFGDLKRKGLLSIDIAQVQTRLLKNPLISEATVERHFPSTLKVTLRERAPIGRIKLKIDGKVSVYYAGRDGKLFTSASYKAPATLPFLYGLSLRQENGQMPLVPGSANLGDLLDGLKTKFPDIYFQLSQIDLSEWLFPVTPQTSVCLQTRSGTKLRFSSDKIDEQLDRLRQTLELMQTEKQTLGKKLIDLTYPDKVAIIDAEAPEKTGVKK